jgi:hypothetical protein
MHTLITAAALALQTQVADTSPFRPLPLPTPTRVRSSSGAPGPDYWQQQASYTIRATLDTAAQTITGSETIHYVNHSPDSLAFVWVQVEQTSSRAAASPTSSTNRRSCSRAARCSTSRAKDSQADHDRAVRRGWPGAGAHRVRYHDARRARGPLAPGGAIDFDVAWHFPVPPYGSGRMGRIGTRLYEIAQWYPRVVVYDDVHGWNPLPYIGAGEFYTEYGDYDVTLTLPAGYVVAATGTVQNPQEVWSPAIRQRLEQATTASERIQVITKNEATANGAHATPGTRSWRLTATNVRDFAWAASPDFRWDASGWNGIRINTFYRPGAAPWEEANRMARYTIQLFSEKWGTYPWPHATTVEGPIEGMEYPMLTFVPAIAKREDQFWVLMHEFGHQWFPMIVGSDERRYPWMDEGFNTFIDYDAAEGYFKGTAYGDTVRRELLTAYRTSAVPGREQPLITKPVEQRDLAWSAYQKPALMLTILRDAVLGRETFERALREYVRRWRFKHPQPADFFRTMANVSGRDLDWFWRGWIYSTARLDRRGLGPSGRPRLGLRLFVESGSDGAPVTLELRFSDGTRETRQLPVEMWNLGDRFTARVATAKPMVGVVVDPAERYPDVDRANNRWGR